MPISGDKKVLEWFIERLDKLQDGEIQGFYLVVDFEIEDYDKIKHHKVIHNYLFYELIIHYHINLWGGAYEYYRALAYFYRTFDFFIRKPPLSFSSNNHRVAILEMTKEEVVLVKFVDL